MLDYRKNKIDFQFVCVWLKSLLAQYGPSSIHLLLFFEFTFVIQCEARGLKFS